jgi:hypothetical protein
MKESWISTHMTFQYTSAKYGTLLVTYMVWEISVRLVNPLNTKTKILRYLLFILSSRVPI